MARTSPQRTAPAPRLLIGRPIGVVGLGQIGGSLVRQLGRHRPALTVRGHDRQADISRKARRYCSWCADLEQLVTSCDIVMLSVPVPEIIRLLPVIQELAAGRTRPRRLLVCDTGTLKAPVVAAAARCAPAYDFVGLHPLAGGERNGWDAARADLFRDRPVIFCPARTGHAAVARELIGLLGAQPVAMDPKVHDRIVARTIGLPHLIAFAAAGLRPAVPLRSPLRGRSWKSLTRVAASDPAMVVGFFHDNIGNQLRALRQFRARLDRVETALQRPSLGPLASLLGRWQHTHRTGQGSD